MSKNATAKRKSPLPTRSRILNAARELFSARGFKGTTTAAIARQAGVNEALIFRHFPAKHDLYTAILTAKLEDEKLVRLLQAAETQALPVEDALRSVGERLLQSYDPTFLRLYFYSALENHTLASDFYEQFTRRFISLVQQLIERGITEGRFRRVNTLLAAQAFFGMFRSYYLGKELFSGCCVKATDQEATDTFCDVFLRGISSGKYLR